LQSLLKGDRVTNGSAVPYDALTHLPTAYHALVHFPCFNATETTDEGTAMVVGAPIEASILIKNNQPINMATTDKVESTSVRTDTELTSMGINGTGDIHILETRPIHTHFVTLRLAVGHEFGIIASRSQFRIPFEIQSINVQS
jgi:hypothetical protein